MVRLRQLVVEDAPGMLEWMTDPSINCFFRFDLSEVSLQSCRSFIASSADQEDTVHYAITDETDTYLGTISLKNIDKKSGSAEYAVSTRKSVHGTDVAAQATRQILGIAFLDYNLNQVYLNVLASNERANGFYKDMGFKMERCDRQVLTIRGKTHDLNWYSMSREYFFEAFGDG